MVEHSSRLDTIFSSLADATRRDILKRVSKKELSISELAQPYEGVLSFAAIAKHVHILDSAGLIEKRRGGRQQFVIARPRAISVARTHLEKYEKLLEARFSQLDKVLKT